MIGRFWHLFLEGCLILGMLLIMKHWIFPFFIHLWFPTSDVVSQLSEWLVLLFGVVTLFVYFGLGSIAKFIYQLTKRQALLLFSIIHVPLLFIDTLWHGLLHDALALFIHGSIIPQSLSVLIGSVLFFLGRSVELIEESIEKKTKQPYRVKVPSRG